MTELWSQRARRSLSPKRVLGRPRADFFAQESGLLQQLSARSHDALLFVILSRTEYLCDLLTSFSTFSKVTTILSHEARARLMYLSRLYTQEIHLYVPCCMKKLLDCIRGSMEPEYHSLRRVSAPWIDEKYLITSCAVVPVPNVHYGIDGLALNHTWALGLIPFYVNSLSCSLCML